MIAYVADAASSTCDTFDWDPIVMNNYGAVLSSAIVAMALTTTACNNSRSDNSDSGKRVVSPAKAVSESSQAPAIEAALNSRLPTRTATFAKAALAAPAAPVEACGQAQAKRCEPTKPGSIYKYIAVNQGNQPCPAPMSETEIAQNLNDPFSTSLLRNGKFPLSVAQLTAAIAEADPDLVIRSYMVGEGSQIPLRVADRDKSRNLRYVVTWGPSKSPQNVQIFLNASAPGKESGFLQVISWDDQRKLFNYFEVLVPGESNAVWSWAGDSSLARAPDTKGAGCFDCHHNGVVIMKELNLPWNNWQSPRAQIAPDEVPKAVANETLFQDLNGADSYESVVMGSAQTYHKQWLQAHSVGADGKIELSAVDLMLEHLTAGTTINIVSSASLSAGDDDISDIPSNALLWDDLLSSSLGLDYSIPALVIPRASYQSFVAEHGYELAQRFPGECQDCANATAVYAIKPGSTHFALYTPAPSFDDRFMITQMLQAEIFDNKFAAAIALVDVGKPVFSSTRAGLQQYAPTSGTIINNESSVVKDFSDAVRQAAAGQRSCDASKIDSCTAEQQFLSIYDAADWTTAAQQRIQTYLDTFAGLSDEARTDKLMRLVASRQQSFTAWPIISNLNEFCLLLPESDLSQ
ncbi:hypothetical protein [Enhygromyxa salina]|uniref:Uncharacterized protein n=1 Tax=Enhygromyxa salina TaxID=215803 RepID=A0A2S9YC92_9BACT|nr:hypothetical protein [Enhygromyxa salina]PRQ02672.1 hypothetical protein ENSA7_55010 [Enhygromyxa salina]